MFSTAAWSTSADEFFELKLGERIQAGGGALLPRLHRVKTKVPRSGGHGEDPRLTGHNHPILSLAMDRLIGLKSSMICDGAPPDLALKDDSLCLQRRYGDGGGRGVTVRQGTRGSDVQNVYFSFTGSFVHKFLSSSSLDVLYGFSVLVLCCKDWYGQLERGSE